MSRMLTTETFKHYPDAQRFIDGQRKVGNGCTLAVGNAGFVIDVYGPRKEAN